MDKQQGSTAWHRKLYSVYPVINHNGKEYEKGSVYVCVCVCVCMTESLCYTTVINTQHCNSTTSVKNIFFKKVTSLAVQWLRLHLPMQGVQVGSQS